MPSAGIEGSLVRVEALLWGMAGEPTATGGVILAEMLDVCDIVAISSQTRAIRYPMDLKVL